MLGHKKLIGRVGAAVTLVIFGAALWVLNQQLQDIHMSEVLAQLRALSWAQVGLALGLTAASYLLLTGYDVLALHHVGKSLPYSKTAQASFIAYAFGHNIGLALISGGSIRYRIYSAAGLSMTEIATVIGLCAVTFGMGTVVVMALVMLLEPGEVTTVLHLRLELVKAAGAVLVGASLAYLAWTAGKRSMLRIGGWSFRPPSFRMAVTQFALAAADLALAASVMYVLMPQVTGLSYAVFLGVYVLAMVAGIVSHVPGGIGVFEGVLLLLLPDIPRDVLLSSALAYRIIYYLTPLGVAAFMMAILEFSRHRRQLARLPDLAEEWIDRLVPQVVGLGVVVAGAILLFSGAIPAMHGRISLIRTIIPLPAIELSHLLASAAGLGLLVLARGLFRRIDAAFQLTAVLLVSGIIASLIKGFDYEEALVLAFVLVMLVLSRNAFNRKASLLHQPFTAGWVMTILVILTASIWLGLVSHKHVDFSNEIWWQFAFHADAPRFLRASVLVCVLGLGFALSALLRPVSEVPEFPDRDSLDRARAVLSASPSANANLALVGDKRLLFSEQSNAFIMYSVEGRSWITLGDPVGVTAEWEELVWGYRELCDRHSGWPVFYQVDVETLPLYLDLGLSLLKLGEEARVPLAEFSMQGSSRAELRQARRRAEREGATFEVVEPEGVPAILAELSAVSDAWLSEKNTHEKRFSVGYFSESYVTSFPCSIVRRDGRIVAFANILPGGTGEEITADLMRYGAKDAPKSVMDYLFVELMFWGKDRGYRWFNMGMAPLSGLEEHHLAPMWHRIGTIVFRYGEHFYNFEGLRQYKEKFDPVWEPKYLATPGGLRVPAVLFNVATLIAGGVTELWSKRGGSSN